MTEMRLRINLVIAINCVTEILARPSVYSARHITHSRDIKPTYDYVIVGGGTAGLTVADRLTENEHSK